ncbi:hypothetical protein Bca4012_084112 [Brassica carinata]
MEDAIQAVSLSGYSKGAEVEAGKVITVTDAECTITVTQPSECLCPFPWLRRNTIVFFAEEVKKGRHTATPHRAKKGGNSPMNANQSPISGGQLSGGNKKQFNSGGRQFGSNGKVKKGKGKGRA